MVLFDVDDVLTDGSLFTGANGERFKKFNAKDGVAAAFLKANGIQVGVISGIASVLNELAASPTSVLERLEKLEQLRALWLGFTISMFNWLEPIHAGVDCLEDVNRVRKILNNNVIE